MRLTDCPRCGYESYEQFRTHSYCYECNYCPDLDWNRTLEAEIQVPQWAINILASNASETISDKKSLTEGAS